MCCIGQPFKHNIFLDFLASRFSLNLLFSRFSLDIFSPNYERSLIEDVKIATEIRDHSSLLHGIRLIKRFIGSIWLLVVSNSTLIQEEDIRSPIWNTQQFVIFLITPPPLGVDPWREYFCPYWPLTPHICGPKSLGRFEFLMVLPIKKNH